MVWALITALIILFIVALFSLGMIANELNNQGTRTEVQDSIKSQAIMDEIIGSTGLIEGSTGLIGGSTGLIGAVIRDLSTFIPLNVENRPVANCPNCVHSEYVPIERRPFKRHKRYKPPSITLDTS